jgi:hypothetical protein
MRTTITLDPDVAARLHEEVRRRDITLKQAVNDALRAGLAGPPVSRPYHVPSRPLQVRPGINLDRALQLAAELEDEEILRKLELRK